MTENSEPPILEDKIDNALSRIRSRLKLTKEYEDKQIKTAISAVKVWAIKHEISDQDRIWEEITDTILPEPDIEGSHRGAEAILTEMEYEGRGKYY